MLRVSIDVKDSLRKLKYGQKHWITKMMLLKSIKKNSWFVILCVMGIIAGVTIGILISSFTERRTGIGIVSKGSIFGIPYLDIQVSPPGYPPIGESWQITVYVVDMPPSSRHLTFQPGLNSTIVVTLLSAGSPRNYNLLVDEYGRATFPYLPEYTDIAFQAEHPDLAPSKRIVLSTHFVSSDVVDTLLTFSSSLVLASLGTGLLEYSGKIRKAKRWLRLERLVIVSAISLSAFVTLSSMYSRLFLATYWGYPENISGSFVTFTFLSYLLYIGIAIFLFYMIVKLVAIGLRKTL